MASPEERERIMAEYVAGAGDDDDDDEAEYDFEAEHDGEDEEGDYDDDDEDEVENDFTLLEGTLSLNDEQRLIYAGIWCHASSSSAENSSGEQELTFKLKSREPLSFWDPQHPTRKTEKEEGKSKESSSMRTILMDGFFMHSNNSGTAKIDHGVSKIKEINVELSFTKQEAKRSIGNGRIATKGSQKDDGSEDSASLKKQSASLKTHHDNDDDVHDDGAKKMSASSQASLKKGDDDEDDCKKAASIDHGKNGCLVRPHVVYNVYGRGSNEYGSFEFSGPYTPSDGTKSNMLVCEKRYIQSGGVATRTAKAGDGDDADADDIYEEQTDYNELIALHQEAGMSVQELRKRYYGSSAEMGKGDIDSSQAAAKKQKTVPSDEEEEDDDAIGF